jgi:hypothetical protein
MPGVARIARPPTVWEQPAATTAAAHKTETSLADTGTALSPSRTEPNRIEYR